MLASQKVPMAQPLSRAQVVGHKGDAPLHTNGEQDGSPPSPAPTGAHRPRSMSQRSQAPAHGVSQHTPSTQFPELHSLPPSQLLPWASLPAHVLPAQYDAGAQPVSFAHAEGHAAEVPPHT